jgi:pentatricopeptide repeat protein
VLGQAASVIPDDVTYGALIEACAKCERKDLALRVYHKALREGHRASLHIYAGAIAACRSCKAVDLKSAMEIYADAQRFVPPPASPPLLQASHACFANEQPASDWQVLETLL